MNKNMGSFIIADIFNKKEVKETEILLRKYFHIEKKEIITVNVKYAMQLDMPRIDKLIKDLHQFQIFNKILNEVFSQAYTSKTYNDLQNKSDYIVYILKDKNQYFANKKKCASENSLMK